jgi:hypothetical protein
VSALTLAAFYRCGFPVFNSPFRSFPRVRSPFAFSYSVFSQLLLLKIVGLCPRFSGSPNAQK